jgi:metallo-beta-lactamase class B
MHNRICYHLSMRLRDVLACIAVLLTATLTTSAQTPADWTTPVGPFQIADNLYYVGSQDLAAYLITTPAGNILINANLVSSPPQIRHSIEQLGFRYADIKILLNGQAHFDHMAGAAQILRETHAKNMVMDGDAPIVESGGRRDPLFASGSISAYPPAHVDRVLHDLSTVTLGNVTLTAHRTAGHTPGCTTWTFRVHLPGDPPTQLRNVVIIGGMALWSDFHLVPTPGHPASYPGIAADFRRTFRILHALPCDIFLGAHGGYFDLAAKLPRLHTEGPRVFIDPTGYQQAVTNAAADFNQAFAAQKATAAKQAAAAKL